MSTDRNATGAPSPFARLAGNRSAAANVAQRAASLATRAQAYATTAPASSIASARPGASATPIKPLRTVTGLLESVRVFGDWAVGSVWSEDRETVKVTGGALKDLQEGAEYTFGGMNRTHPKYGESLEVSVATPFVKLDERAIKKFIERNFKGIGQKTAEKFVAHVVEAGGQNGLAALRQQLLDSPWTVDFSAVTKKGEYDKDQNEHAFAAYIQRDLATRLGAINGMRDGVLKALALHLASELHKSGAMNATQGEAPNPVTMAWAVLARNPYGPIPKIPGYGFVAADAIGRSVNIPREAPVRLAALVAHALEEHCSGHGHTFLSGGQLHEAIRKLDGQVRPAAALEHAIAESTIVAQGVDPDAETHGAGDTMQYYPPDLYDAETKLASRIADLLQPTEPLGGRWAKKDREVQQDLRGRIQKAAREVSPKLKQGLDQTQEDALANLLTSKVRIHTLTAGPGCGKTQLMEVLVKLLPSKEIRFCGPTGKSAKVLGNRVERHGCTASTIHSLLQGAGRGEFRYCESERLTGDVLVIDEGSMPDVTLFDAALAAANDGMHVIVLGDPGQLASIQPGRVLADLLAIEGIDHNHLSKTHRNSGGILDVVKEVGRGELNPTNRESVSFSQSLGEASDDFHSVMGVYLEAVRRRGFDKVMLMMSRRQGEPVTPGWNTTYANAVLRNVCNPSATKVPGMAYHVGDRIIIRANMEIEQPEELGDASSSHAPRTVRVVNGDTGRIEGYTLDTENRKNGAAKWVAVELDDGRTIQFPGDAASALGLSYALTVHAAQGSEYEEVIAVVTPGSPHFINRTTVFTAFSRAQHHLHIYGNDHELVKIARTSAPRRNSALVERVGQCLRLESDAQGEPGENAGAESGPGDLDDLDTVYPEQRHAA